MYSRFLVVDFGSSNTGLPAVGYQKYAQATDSFSARVSAGVVELIDGKYGAPIGFNDTDVGAVVWDSGEVSPIYAIDIVNPELVPGEAYSLFVAVDFGSSRTGLATVGYTKYSSSAVPGSRITAGVSEIIDGKYGALISFAADETAAIVWDSGEGSPVYAVEVINPPPAAAEEPALPNEAVSTTTAPCVYNGSTILFPLRVKSVVAAALDGEPIDIRNMLFQYQQNGPGRFGCADMLIDEGERRFPESGKRRRQYRLTRGGSQDKNLTFVAKLKWVRKEPNEEMVIRNFEAMRLMATAVMYEKQGNTDEAAKFEAKALNELDKELAEYLAGQQLTIPFRTDYFQERLQGVGGML